MFPGVVNASKPEGTKSPTNGEFAFRLKNVTFDGTLAKPMLLNQVSLRNKEDRPCVSLSAVPGKQINDDNCEGERERVTITGVTHHGDIPLVENVGLDEFTGLKDLVGKSFKVCAWQADRSDNAVENQVQGGAVLRRREQRRVHTRVR